VAVRPEAVRPEAVRSRSRGAVAALAAVVAFAVPEVVNPAAAAAADDIKNVTVTSAATSGAKVVVGLCPATYVAVGAHASVAGNPYGVHITKIWPRNGSFEVRAEVFAEAPVPAPWKLVVTGICVPFKAGITNVLGPVRIGNRFSDEDRRYGTVTNAMCPTGKELIGMGGRADGGYLEELQPLGQGTPYTNDSSPLMHGVNVLGHARVGASTNATVQGIAVCANPGNLSTFGYTDTFDNLPTRTVTAACPVGTRVHSVGFIIFYPNHYLDNTPYSYATVSRAAAQHNSPTSVQLVAQRHRDVIPAEKWTFAPELLCAA
jgi:hypothetical protein